MYRYREANNLPLIILILGVELWAGESVSNCDNGSLNKVSYYSSNSSNAPTTATGWVFTIGHPSSSNLKWAWQFAYVHSADELYWRGKNNGYWDNWKKIS